MRRIGGGIERLKPWRHSRGLNKKTDHMQKPEKNQKKIIQIIKATTKHTHTENCPKQSAVIALAINNIFMAKRQKIKTYSNDCSNNRLNEFHSRSLKETFFFLFVGYKNCKKFSITNELWMTTFFGNEEVETEQNTLFNFKKFYLFQSLESIYII